MTKEFYKLKVFTKTYKTRFSYSNLTYIENASDNPNDSVMNTLLKRTYNVEMNMNLRHRDKHNYNHILKINFIK